MKNKFLLSIILIFSVTQLFSQESDKRWSTSLGVMIVPQGGIDLMNTKDGFSNQSNVLFVANFSKGKNTFVPFYSVKNDVGLAHVYSFTENYGIYSVATKKVLDTGGYFGIGGTRSVGTSSIFIEAGTLWNTWSPSISIGAFIPLTFKI